MRHNIFDSLPTCLWCGEEFEPSPGSTGKYCSKEHSDKARAVRFPDSWRAIHAYMLSYQKSNDRPPSMDEIIANCPLKAKSSVFHALNKMRERSLVTIVGDPAHARRYRAQGNFPVRSDK